MNALWLKGSATVQVILESFSEKPALAYNSVLTTIRILEQKGYVQHHQEGRAFVYSPSVQEHEAGRSEVRHILSRFFGNSREQLLLSLLGDDEISPEELRRLKDAIQNAAEDADPNPAPKPAQKSALKPAMQTTLEGN